MEQNSSKKNLGLVNMLLGVPIVFIMILQLVHVYPKIQDLYSDMELELPMLTELYPYIVLFVLASTFLSILVGAVLKFSKGFNEKTYKVNKVFIVVNVIIIFLGFGLIAVSLLSPIYGITSAL